MGFWWFMFLTALLIPAIMILAGRFMEKHCPKKINSVIGYRTVRSMKNMDTWRFANAHCGRLWQKIGWRMLPVSALPMLLTIGAHEDVVALIGLMICMLQCISLIVSVFPTERALAKRFCEDGTRRIFYTFSDQRERRKAGGSCFLEMQYCTLKKGTSFEEMLSAMVVHWMDDSLYIDGDCIDEFEKRYGVLFDGRVDCWGAQYYSPEQVEGIISQIEKDKPQEHEVVLAWLEKAKEYNGIYILGI